MAWPYFGAYAGYPYPACVYRRIINTLGIAGKPVDLGIAGRPVDLGISFCFCEGFRNVMKAPSLTRIRRFRFPKFSLDLRNDDMIRPVSESARGSRLRAPLRDAWRRSRVSNLSTLRFDIDIKIPPDFLTFGRLLCYVYSSLIRPLARESVEA